MRCVRCEAETAVLDSRAAAMNTIRRRRECTACGHRFTTYESTVSPARALKQISGQAERSRRWYLNLSPEVREARAKRINLRAAARAEAKATGEPVASVFNRYGCE